MENKFSIKDVVRRPNVVKFDHFKDGSFMYHAYDVNKSVEDDRTVYRFKIPMEDVQDAKMPDVENAMMFMRFIRKAIERGECEKIEVKAGETV
jgi:hypothetical protein